MELILDIIHKFISPEILAMIFGVLFFVSEALAQIPVVKSNSVFQLIRNVIKKLAGK